MADGDQGIEGRQALPISRRSQAMRNVTHVIAGVAVVNFALFAQTTSDLGAPMLKANASLAQNNPPGRPIPESLVSARALAAKKGLPWKGLDLISFDHVVLPTRSITTALLQLYQKQACQADA